MTSEPEPMVAMLTDLFRFLAVLLWPATVFLRKSVMTGVPLKFLTVHETLRTVVPGLSKYQMDNSALLPCSSTALVISVLPHLTLNIDSAIWGEFLFSPPRITTILLEPVGLKFADE